MKISGSRVMTAVAALMMVAGVAAWSVAVPFAQGQTSRARPAQASRVEMFGSVEIGVSVQDVESADVTRLKLPFASGAIVNEVRSNGPAAKAGFKVDDVIVNFDGQTVRSAKQLVRLVDETPDGREVEATVLRDGARVNLKVTPAASDAWTMLSGPGWSSGSGDSILRQFQFNGPNGFAWAQPFLNDRVDTLISGNTPRLGVEVQELSGQLGDYFGAKEGVLVTSVDDGTPAKTAGLRAGDVITKINARPVLSTDELRRRITGVTGDVTITIVRDRKEQTLTAKLDAPAPKTIIK